MTASGVVEEGDTHEGSIRLQLHPSSGGLVLSVIGLVLGLVSIIIGIVQFAIHSEWQSWGIATGIGLALAAVPLLLLAWAVHEGRNNERELLGLLGPCFEGAPSQLG